MNAAVPLLAIEHLSLAFPTAMGRVQALDDICLDLSRGRTLGLVGESGSGKSVLSRAILRLLPPSAQWSPEGQVRFHGENLLALGSKGMQQIRGRRIAMIFQDPMTALNPVRTIGAQLMEGMCLHLGIKRREAEQRALDLLKQVGIPSPASRINQFPHELSGGMRQRVVIAMAIACEPDLLIADEPTTALDVTVQAEILDLLKEVQARRQMAMLLITHDLGVAAGYCDDIAVMYAGQLVEMAATESLFRRPRMPYTRALMDSIPRMEDEPHSTLHSIPGRPAMRMEGQCGCPFADRCSRRRSECLDTTPELKQANGGFYRCHNPLEAP